MENFPKEEIIQAIQLSFNLASTSSNDVENSNLKTKVTLYLSQLDQSNNNWFIFINLLVSQNEESITDEVKFYCLQKLRDILIKNSLNNQNILIIKQHFTTWLKQKRDSFINEKPFVRNFISVIYTLLLKKLFPSDWSTGFEELLEIGLLSHVYGGIEFVLKVLLYVDQEIVTYNVNRTKDEIKHNTLIKDTMREGILDKIVEFWYIILITCKDSNPLLVLQCLKVMQEYIGWIDIKLTVNDKILPIIYYYLNKPIYQNEASDCIYELIAKGMPIPNKYELIKSINVVQVLSFCCNENISLTQELQKVLLNLPEISSNSLSFFSIDHVNLMKTKSCDKYSLQGYSDDRAFFGLAADLGCFLSTELAKAESTIHSLNDLQVKQQFLNMLKTLTNLCLGKFLAVEDLEVRRSAAKSADALINHIRSELEARQCDFNTLLNEGDARENLTLGRFYSGFLPQLCQALYVSSCYPLEFDFELEEEDPTDEDVALFHEVRKEFRKMFINIGRFALQEASLPFVEGLAPTLLKEFNVTNKKSCIRLEGFLMLIQSIPEGTGNIFNIVVGKGKVKGLEPEKDNMKAKQLRQRLANLIDIIVKTDFVSSCKSEDVSFLLAMYIDCVTRYIPLIVEFHPNSLEFIFKAFLTECGLGHPSSRIRSQASYLLLRVIKASSNKIEPHLAQLQAIIFPLLNISFDVVKEEIQKELQQEDLKSSLKFCLDDLLNLYESSSVLISCSWRPTLDLKKINKNTSLALTPLSETLGNIKKECQKPNITQDELLLCDKWTGMCLQAITCLSKNFTNEESKSAVYELFLSFIMPSFDICTLIEKNANFSFIKSKSTLFLKLMMFLHRLVAAFRVKMLPIIENICEKAMLSVNSPSSACEFVQFLSQITREYKLDIKKATDVLFQPVMKMVNTYFESNQLKKPDANDQVSTLSEREKQYIDLDKALLNWIYEITSAKMTSVFYSTANVTILEEVLLYLCSRGSTAPSPPTQKLCFVVLTRLLRSWIPFNFEQGTFEGNVQLVRKVILSQGGSPDVYESILPFITQDQQKKIRLSTKTAFDDLTSPPVQVQELFVKIIFTQATFSSITAVQQKYFVANDASSLILMTQLCAFHLNLLLCLGPCWLGFFAKEVLAKTDSLYVQDYIHALLNEANVKVMRHIFKKLFIKNIN